MANDTTILSRPVWSSYLRLSHWLLAVSSLILLSTGWLIKNAPTVAEIASEYHHILAVVLTVSLGFRLLLLFFDISTGQYKNMLKAWPRWRHLKQMSLFYLTLGRSECPKWLAHNFSWVPLYFILFLLLLLQIISGIMMIYQWLPLAIYPPELHNLLANLIFWWVLFHFYAVVLHDLKGKQGDISAMINGTRYFTINTHKDSDRAKLPSKTSSKSSISINISDIK